MPLLSIDIVVRIATILDSKPTTLPQAKLAAHAAGIFGASLRAPAFSLALREGQNRNQHRILPQRSLESLTFSMELDVHVVGDLWRGLSRECWVTLAKVFGVLR